MCVCVCRDDIEAFIASKNKEVCVKLANFVRKNDLAPVMIKLKVVNASTRQLLIAQKHGVAIPLIMSNPFSTKPLKSPLVLDQTLQMKLLT